MSTKFLEVVRRIHHNVEVALGATLFAFVMYLFVFWLPHLPEIQAQYARIRVSEINAENAAFCEKLNIKHGTEKYNECLLFVGDFRMKVQQRTYDEVSPW